MKFEFDLILQAGNQNGAFVLVPLNTKEVFGSARPKVIATFNRRMVYRGSLIKYGSDWPILIVLKDIRQELNIHPGDTVLVQLELDTEPRRVEIPRELIHLMNDDDLKHFQSLSYTHKKEHAKYISEAIKEETRMRRAHKTLENLRKR